MIPITIRTATAIQIQVVVSSVDGVLCATAELLNLSPGVVRPALLTAVRRMRELGLDIETVEGALAPKVEEAKKT